MYSQQFFRSNHDEWLRDAEARRLAKQARSGAREAERSHGRGRPQRGRFRALGLRRPLRHA